MAANIFQSLLRMISPKEAEAKIVGDKRAMAVLRSMIGTGQQGHLPQAYEKIIRQADKVPQTVEIQGAPGLGNVYSGVGEYLPGQQKVLYDPSLSDADLGGTLNHELLHFLNSINAPQLDLAEQHRLIKGYLGSDVYKPAAELEGYNPTGLSEEDMQVLQRWLGEK